MARAALPTGIELEYETFGSPDDPTLLLVMGFTAQMTLWDVGFCQLLAAAGLHVVRFDNRDCGLSTRLDGQHADAAAAMGAVLTGTEMPPVPYTLSDMAADAVGLLDHLGVERAHVLGASMGGMIVQTMAIEHPERLESVVSVMSMPGDVAVGRPDPAALEVLLSPPPTEREAYIENSVRTLVWASKRYGDADRIRRNAARDFDRAFYPEGATRQLAAIYASGDRSEALRSVTVPMLVIHGRDDTLISPSGGERTAELVPGANLLMLADMGHDLPEQLWPLIVDAVTMHTAHAARMRELV
jgi:pimeloyl-ACP methyl ester carboxylesterase